MATFTFLQTATEVCRTIGSQGDGDQITAAKTAVQFAIREMNQKHNWSFKLLENTAIAIVNNVTDYLIPDAKKIYSVRIAGSNPRTLGFIRQRDWDRAIRSATSSGGYYCFYTTIESPTGLSIRLFSTPNASGNITVRYYADIELPAGDGDLLDVPERFTGLVLALSNAYYLANRDAENPRTAYWRSQAEALLQSAMEDDADRPDEDLVMNDWQYFEGGRLGQRNSLGDWESDF